MGRPTKRTPETEKLIIDALRVGASRKDSCEAAGIDFVTFMNWMKSNSSFSTAVTRAESQCAARMSARIYQEATKDDGDWKASLEWLKRRRREDWGDRKDITSGGEPIGVFGYEIITPGTGDEERENS